MGALITTAEAGFASTTGFSIADLVTWTGTNLLTLFIGTTVAILYELRYWIAALLVISAVIFFAYRALRFKH